MVPWSSGRSGMSLGNDRTRAIATAPRRPVQLITCSHESGMPGARPSRWAIARRSAEQPVDHDRPPDEHRDDTPGDVDGGLRQHVQRDRDPDQQERDPRQDERHELPDGVDRFASPGGEQRLVLVRPDHDPGDHDGDNPGLVDDIRRDVRAVRRQEVSVSSIRWSSVRPASQADERSRPPPRWPRSRRSRRRMRSAPADRLIVAARPRPARWRTRGRRCRR